MTSKDALAALLREQRKKDPELAAKQRRLLETRGLTQQTLDELDQQRVADADAARLSELHKDDR